MTDVFISYARADKDFALRLNNALGASNKELWIDLKDISPSVEWLDEIYRGIEKADNFVFILSPDSIISEVCQLELSHAIKHNKRLLPIEWREIDAYSVPEALRSLNWIFFQENDDFDQAVEHLTQAIDTDFDWVHRHTELLSHANEWDRKQRDRSLLLSGRTLLEAEQWLAEGEEKAPQPTDVQTQFIQISHQANTRRRHIIQGIVISVLIASGLLGFWAFTERQGRGRADNIALARRLVTQANLMRTQNTNRPDLRAFLALEAKKRLDAIEAPSVGADQALREAFAMLTHPVHRLAHEAPVTALIFSPDGDHLAALSEKGEVHVWSIPGWKKIDGLHHQRRVQSIAFTSGRHILGTGVKKYVARVWDLFSGEEKARFAHDGEPIPKDFKLGKKIPKSLVESAALAPGGRYLATTGFSTVRIWDIETKKEVVRIKGVTLVKDMAFSADAKHLAINNWSKALVFEVDGGKRMAGLEVGEGQMALSLGGRYLATVRDKEVVLRDTSTGRQVGAGMRHEGDVQTLVFSADGKFLATGSVGQTARVWRVRTGEELARIRHSGVIAAVAFNPTSRTLAIAGNGGLIQIRRAGGGLETARLMHQDSIESIAFSSDGCYLATGGADSRARLWDVDSHKLVADMEHDNQVNHLAFSADGKYLATTNLGHTWLWESPSGKRVTRMKHPNLVWRIAFSPDSRYLATSGLYDFAILWNIDARKLRRIKHGNHVRDLAFSNDGAYLATASSTVARVWDMQNGEVISRMSHDDQIQTIDFSPTGEYIATGGDNKAVIVWRRADGEEVARIVHPGPVTAVTFSADGRYLATMGESARFWIWETISGQPVFQNQHDAEVTGFAFSPVGPYLATASKDRTARVWHVKAKRELARMPHDDGVNAIMFSPDGRYLATASRDHTARLWLWHTRDLIPAVCARLSSQFITPEPWREFLGRVPYQSACATPVSDPALDTQPSLFQSLNEPETNVQICS